MIHGDTIVAISSAVGAAIRMIVRVSGKDAHGIAVKLCPGLKIEAGRAVHCGFRIADFGFDGWVYAFCRPNSYTGEDLVEFHIPGNVLLVNKLVENIVRLGARRAEAGEFTGRAYFNGRMDLSQAEGVAATIAAQNEQELQAARQLMAGELARRLRPVMELIAETLALVEVGIDFTEEDVTFISRGDLEASVGRAGEMLGRLVEESARFERLSAEPIVALIGRPNAGKSTLLNALSGQERAVVSPVAGTTRDVISAQVRLRRGWVKVVDVAGVEERKGDKETGRQGEQELVIEVKMQERARAALEAVDVVVMVREVGDEGEAIGIVRRPELMVRSKVDLKEMAQIPGVIGVSAVTGVGMSELREALDQLCFGEQGGAGTLALNARHLEAIGEAREALSRIAHGIDAGAEVVAMELREALDSLGAVLGKMSTEDVLERVFGKFCIGK